MQASSESRITELQNEALLLRKQVDELKTVLETELSRMRADVQAQLDEAKRVLVSREAESMARVTQLEAQVRGLARLCERALHQEELMATVEHLQQPQLPSSSTCANSQTALESTPPGGPLVSADSSQPDEVLAVQQSAEAGPVSARDTATSALKAAGDLEKRLDRVYAFYTSASVANADVLEPAMHLTHFTVMMRDAGACGGGSSIPPELLWIEALREMEHDPWRDPLAHRTGSTLLLPHVYDSDGEREQAGLFTHLRLHRITRAQLPKVLLTVCRATAPSSRGSTVSPERFRSFLTDSFLPAVETQMQRRLKAKGQPATTGGAESLARAAPFSVGGEGAQLDDGDATDYSSVVRAYIAGNAAETLRPFSARTKRAFLKATRGSPQQPLCTARLSFAQYVECCREHDLLPLVSKLQLKSMFRFLLKQEALLPGGLLDQCIGYGTFTTSLYCLAELIYGSSADLRDFYPTPSARLSKLLVKLFVL